MNNMTVTIFASEISGLLGYLEKYNKPSNYFKDIIIRRNFGDKEKINEIIKDIQNGKQFEDSDDINVKYAKQIILNNNERKLINKLVEDLNQNKEIHGDKNYVNCAKGIYNENKNLIQSINNSQKSFKKKIGDILFYGKVDGYDEINNEVIEYKNRQKNLLNGPRKYEIPQLLCYMFITDTYKLKFIEQYNDIKKITYYQFDMEAWMNIVKKLSNILNSFDTSE